ncbi:cytochrome c biogenesis protein CcsA [Myceligenerans salitolerans]|uniref:Heme exporter protein C n=1 Tax=Myceligenerans salitolerans TaxID=1230528 RepID=A0ABS3I7Q2_9MICO|nr:cytochrome c biogenesis protein CcsA [Myceligenerans salitolerans]MBO0609030.1 cytochrome c biogenesis protein CcsA [Myceligenerans salitolerans]
MRTRPDRPAAPGPRPRQALTAAAGVTTAVALVLALVVAPPDAVQGEAQRWMYLHVPAAWSAYLCFAVVLVACLPVVRHDAARPRAVARAAAETGVALTALTLLTGSIWGAQTWGTWWVWDARVTTTVAMGLVHVAFLATLALATTRRARRAAGLVGVLGFLMVPVVHLSVVWWRTLHQPPTLLAPGAGAPIAPVMAWTLGVCVLACTLLTAAALLTRVRSGAPHDAVVPARPAATAPAPRPQATP